MSSHFPTATSHATVPPQTHRASTSSSASTGFYFPAPRGPCPAWDLKYQTGLKKSTFLWYFELSAEKELQHSLNRLDSKLTCHLKSFCHFKKANKPKQKYPKTTLSGETLLLYFLKKCGGTAVALVLSAADLTH